ncbi:MAG: hypothetical protein OEM67_02020 [Thermoleophilia bacterium]|nr:hypothetical protein [Thermoleophilia bacterium]MDH3724404.1 hypothetical protein [Thermoleophilia bacterium]
MLSRTSRIRRTPLLAALGIGALTLMAPAQSLAGPLHSIATGPTGLSLQSGNLVASLGDNSIRTTGPLSAGNRAGFRYCPPWANSTVRTLKTRSTRWHSTPHVGYLRVLGAGGEVGRITDAQQAYLDPVRTDSWNVDSRCATLEFYASGARSHAGIWTAQIVGAAVEDQQGPSVTGVSAAQGWIMGSSTPITLDTADNGLGQQPVSVSIGSVLTNAGNLASGRRTVNAGLGSLPDGQHAVTVTRTGFGWPAQSRSTQIKIDRTPPGAPYLSATTTAWTYVPVDISAPQTADGTGSGWKENQFSIDGGPWAASSGPRLTENGIHAVAARAVDHAGNASAARSLTVKIDRDNPSGSLTKARRVATGAAVATVAVSDSLSGVRAWTLLGGDGAILATGTGPGREVVITGLLGVHKLRLVAEDIAGNSAEVASANVDFGQGAMRPAPPPTLPADLGPAPQPTRLGVPVTGLAGARVQKGTPLPFWVRSIRGVGPRRAYALGGNAIRLRLAGVSRRARIGRRYVPLVRVTGNTGRRVVTGRFTTTSGSRLPYPYVVVRNPSGDIVQTRRGGKRGSFRLTVDKAKPGKWTVALWGRPERRFTILVRPAARLKTSLRKTTLNRHAVLKLTGRVTPAKDSRGRVVQLQWLDEGLDTPKWKPIVNARINRQGRLLLRYRFRRAGGYSVRMRVVVLGSPGSPTLRTAPHAITVLP